jgi:hypothetical protein
VRLNALVLTAFLLGSGVAVAKQTPSIEFATAPTPVIMGQNVTFTAILTTSSGVPITGDVLLRTYLLNETLAVTTISSGVATWTLAFPFRNSFVDGYSLYAHYAGDANFYEAKSALISVIAYKPLSYGVRGDFNGDGQADLLWRGDPPFPRTKAWLMTGSVPTGQTISFGGPAEGWTIMSTADFNGDGTPDLLEYYPNSNAVVLELMNGGIPIAPIGIISSGASTVWQMVGVADFNRDGKQDIVWHNSATLQNVVWLMNGANYLGELALPYISADWSIIGIADLDRDGHPDLVLQSASTFRNVIWLMNGVSYLSEARLPSGSSNVWKLSAIADYNSDGKLDLVWRNASNHRTVIWLLDGTNYLSEREITVPEVTDPSWHLVGPR